MDGGVIEAIGVIRSGVDALLKAAPGVLSSTELTAAMLELEVQRRRVESVDQVLIAEAVQRGAAGEYARTSMVDLLADLLRVSPGEAKARVARARDMGPRRDLCGQPLEPILPLVADAQRVGAISAQHASVITRCVDAIPARLAGQFTAIVEQALVEQALHVEPRQVAKAGQLLLARIDQDGPEPRDRDSDAQRRREFGIRMNPDGTGVPYGRLTPQTAAVWHPIIDALSQPVPAPDGTPDPRSAGQRRHDGFLDAGRRLLRSGTLPDCGGTPVTVLVTIPLADLLARTGHSDTGHSDTGHSDTGHSDTGHSDTGHSDTGYTRTAHGDLITIADLLHMAAEADIVPTVLDDTGGVLAYGRTRRLASPGQRLALAARDKGCSFPQCTRPPAWCESHHVIPWLDGGLTDLDNLTLVCGFHHREFERRGWTVHITAGVPQWTPPAWLDPERKPRRNTAHHIPEITFDTGSARPFAS